MFITVTFKDENGVTVGQLTAKDKTFASGSRGLFGQDKIEIEGKRYQTQVQMVEIGSKKVESKQEQKEEPEKES